MDNSISRRKFLAASSKGVAATLLMFPAAAALSGAVANGAAPPPGKKIVVDLEAPENGNLKRIGGAVKVFNPADPHRPLLVTRISTDEYDAFSSRCTHLGCEVELPNTGVIHCKCHGSQFDPHGKVTKGPAKKDLPKFTTSLRGTRLEIADII
jgi:Rieske Fe-S protein